MGSESSYTSLHPFQVVSDQTEAPLGSMSHEELQIFGRRPFCKWWCQEGPVDNCCCCFPLRTGMVLLSLENIFTGGIKFFGAQLNSWYLGNLQEQHNSLCSKGDNSEICKALSQRIIDLEFMGSIAPLLYAVGVMLLFFSVVGIRAAYTGSPRLAKLYMLAYPILFSFEVTVLVLMAVMAPSSITWIVQLQFSLDIFFITYYTKVTWSFYKRRKVMENM